MDQQLPADIERIFRKPQPWSESDCGQINAWVEEPRRDAKYTPEKAKEIFDSRQSYVDMQPYFNTPPFDWPDEPTFGDKLAKWLMADCRVAHMVGISWKWLYVNGITADAETREVVYFEFVEDLFINNKLSTFDPAKSPLYGYLAFSFYNYCRAWRQRQYGSFGFRVGKIVDAMFARTDVSAKRSMAFRCKDSCTRINLSRL